MKICFLGDSITAGAGASKYELCYVEQVGKMLGCEVENFGVGGTRIATQKSVSDDPLWDEHFMIRAEKMGASDRVFVLGGTNDYGHSDAKFGKMGDDSEYTFYGAFGNLVKYLVGKYGTEKLCFILPIPRYNMSSPNGSGERKANDERYKGCDLHTLSEYINAEIEILGKYGVEYLDLSKELPEPDTNGASEFFIDGLHPNDLGHKIIAERISEYVRAKM